MLILAIETSCDETSCAVVCDGRTVLSNIISSQIEEHKLYGGVVPEIASRRHCENIVKVCELALATAKVTLSDIEVVAVTAAPGLIGALLVGVNFAKGIALALGKPLIPVHHIRGHVAACYIEHPELKPPFTALIVSGGHTTITRVNDYTSFDIIGTTLDDAAGEAFDKAARAMGLPYPGGVHIDKTANKNSLFTKYTLPHPKTENKHDFSFSGLKTAVVNLIHNARQSGKEIDVSELAACFQHTVCEILTDKTMSAVYESKLQKLVLAGGVAANSHLRDLLEQHCNAEDVKLYYPSIAYCGDNAAMIGCQSYYEFLAGNTGDSSLNATATMKIGSDWT